MKKSLIYALAAIRTESTIKSKDWLDKVTDAYKEGSKLNPDERLLLYYDGKEEHPLFEYFQTYFSQIFVESGALRHSQQITTERDTSKI